MLIGCIYKYLEAGKIKKKPKKKPHQILTKTTDCTTCICDTWFFNSYLK